MVEKWELNIAAAKFTETNIFQVVTFGGNIWKYLPVGEVARVVGGESSDILKICAEGGLMVTTVYSDNWKRL